MIRLISELELFSEQERLLVMYLLESTSDLEKEMTSIKSNRQPNLATYISLKEKFLFLHTSLPELREKVISSKKTHKTLRHKEKSFLRASLTKLHF